MFITKSLMVEYINCPKLAWWHINNKPVYNFINEELYKDMDGIAIGQATEDAVLKNFDGKNILGVDEKKLNFYDWHNSYFGLTKEIFIKYPDVIYQGGFVYKDLFIKSDLLVLNSEGKYDLIEVKSKNSIRNKNKENLLLDDLLMDVSFQNYVLKKILKGKYSGIVKIAYLNKEYKKNGDLDYNELINFEDVTNELISFEEIENLIEILRNDIILNQFDFEKKYPYNGENYLLYYGENPPEGSIWQLPSIGKKVMDLLPKKFIMELDEIDMQKLFNSKNQQTKTSKFLKLYQTYNTYYDEKGIKNLFEEKLGYPLFFYDYETVSWPIPLLDGTSPWQQVIVQYSVHKIDKDGNIKHKDCLIPVGQKDNKIVIKQLVEDLEGGDGTYIVWYKGFENSRNNETIKMYPEYKEVFEKINKNTFDLMDVFSNMMYFDRRFCGSSSIKKVLPVLTDISYEGMDVPNGAIATDKLRRIIQNEFDEKELQKIKGNLLEYCKLDTRAMVAIYEKLLKLINCK